MKAFEKLMLMDDRVWARHANPLSVYSRFSVLPLLTLAAWSRVWGTTWFVLLMLLALAWNWYNPRAFKPVKEIKGWASEGVMGERIYLDRKAHKVATEHVTVATTLLWLSGVFGLIWLWGLWTLRLEATLLSMLLMMITKCWFFDRMVWLYRDHSARGRDSHADTT